MQTVQLSSPLVVPSRHIVDDFWKKIAQLTTRHHGAQNKWIGGQEIRDWNQNNRSACKKCANSKNKRLCVIDSDHPSCRACREIKVACDRKPRFLFDMTKDDFFPTYEQFMAVFQDKKSSIRHPRPAAHAEDTRYPETRPTGQSAGIYWSNTMLPDMIDPTVRRSREIVTEVAQIMMVAAQAIDQITDPMNRHELTPIDRHQLEVYLEHIIDHCKAMIGGREH
ncbi:hypothetical protein C8R44DRAFT_882649 [Mycena epipterygia]|nr:hypothetical protein C8R44DRAFT_882649 [Mycena epipterygia]